MTQGITDSSIQKVSIISFNIEYGCIATVTGWNQDYLCRSEAEKQSSLVFEYRPMHYKTLLHKNQWHVDREYTGYVSMNSFVPLISGLYVYNWKYNILQNQTYYSKTPTLLKIIDLLYSWRDKQDKKVKQLEKENKKLKQRMKVKEQHKQ